MADQLLRYHEAAARLAVKEATVRRLANAGVLPKIRPTTGRAVRFRATDVDAIIQRGRAALTASEGVA